MAVNPLCSNTNPQERLTYWYNQEKVCHAGNQLPTSQDRVLSATVNPVKGPQLEVIGLPAQDVAVASLNRQDVPIKLPSSGLCLFPENSGRTAFAQRSLSENVSAVSVRNHYPILSHHHHHCPHTLSTPHPQHSGSVSEEGARHLRAGGMERERC